jgi:two-component system, cell cycle sensor histidine kinase and response regulator CckA
VFTVLLPASRVATRKVDVSTAPNGGNDGTGLGAILFVDDDPALRRFGQQALEERGYRVLLAENGRQALAVLTAHPEVGAVVLDLAMPVMGGETAGPMMRSLRPDVPVIISSGYPESDALERVGHDVAAAFLEKPYRADMLVSRVEEAFRSRPNS